MSGYIVFNYIFISSYLSYQISITVCLVLISLGEKLDLLSVSPYV